MYTTTNFRSKADVKRAIAAGRKVTCYQPNGDLTGTTCPRDGTVYLEGPHYPEPHKWYGQGTMKDGFLVAIKTLAVLAVLVAASPAWSAELGTPKPEQVRLWNDCNRQWSDYRKEQRSVDPAWTAPRNAKRNHMVQCLLAK